MSEYYTKKETELILKLTQDFAKVINKFQDDHQKEICVEDRACLLQHSLCDIVLSFVMAATEPGYEKEVLDEMRNNIIEGINFYSRQKGQLIN
jgi:hypothetical protein